MRLKAHTIRDAISLLMHGIYLDPGVRQILIAFGRSNSTIRPFEFEEGKDRPWSASRITSTGFLTLCKVNSSELKINHTCTRPRASSENARVQSADGGP